MIRLHVRTDRHTHVLEITSALQARVDAEGWRDGILTVFVPHTTAGVMINEHADPDVAADLERRFDALVPWTDPADRHAEGNTAAHLKTAWVGSSATVFVEGGRLRMGTWQGVFLCEFDGPRTRELWLRFSP